MDKQATTVHKYSDVAQNKFSFDFEQIKWNMGYG